MLIGKPWLFEFQSALLGRNADEDVNDRFTVVRVQAMIDDGGGAGGDYWQSGGMRVRRCDGCSIGDSGRCGGTGGVFGAGGLGRDLTAALIEELYTPRGWD